MTILTPAPNASRMEKIMLDMECLLKRGNPPSWPD
jgi:hypothetical protein